MRFFDLFIYTLCIAPFYRFKKIDFNKLFAALKHTKKTTFDINLIPGEIGDSKIIDGKFFMSTEDLEKFSNLEVAHNFSTNPDSVFQIKSDSQCKPSYILEMSKCEFWGDFRTLLSKVDDENEVEYFLNCSDYLGFIYFNELARRYINGNLGSALRNDDQIIKYFKRKTGQL
jgi:hypothetical protein